MGNCLTGEELDRLYVRSYKGVDIFVYANELGIKYVADNGGKNEWMSRKTIGTVKRDITRMIKNRR